MLISLHITFHRFSLFLRFFYILNYLFIARN